MCNVPEVYIESIRWGNFLDARAPLVASVNPV